MRSPGSTRLRGRAVRSGSLGGDEDRRRLLEGVSYGSITRGGSDVDARVKKSGGDVGGVGVGGFNEGFVKPTKTVSFAGDDEEGGDEQGREGERRPHHHLISPAGNRSSSAGILSSGNGQQQPPPRSPSWRLSPARRTRGGGKGNGGVMAGVLAPKEAAGAGGGATGSGAVSEEGKAFGVDSEVAEEGGEEDEEEEEEENIPSFIVLDCSKVTNVSRD